MLLRTTSTAYGDGFQNGGMGLPKCGRRRFLRYLPKCSFTRILVVITPVLNGNKNICYFKTSQTTGTDCVPNSPCHSDCESCRYVCTRVPCKHRTLAPS